MVGWSVLGRRSPGGTQVIWNLVGGVFVGIGGHLRSFGKRPLD